MKYLVARINEDGVIIETFLMTGKFDDKDTAVASARKRAFANSGCYRVYEAVVDVTPVKAVDVVDLRAQQG